MELKVKKQKYMLLQNEVNVKFEVQTPYKKKNGRCNQFWICNMLFRETAVT